MTRSRRRWQSTATVAGRLTAVLVIVSIATYGMLQLLPGDPARTILGPNATPAEVDALRDALGLNEPLISGYVTWVGDVLRGDLGIDLTNGIAVTTLIGDALPATVELLVVSQVVALAVAVPLAMIGARRAGAGVDRAMTGAALGLIALPNFVLGLGLIFVVGLRLDLLPTVGWTPFGEDPVEHVRTLILPVVTLAAAEAAVYLRVLRTELIGTLQEDYVLGARSAGFDDRRIMWRHALRPSSLPLVTLVGLNVGRLLGGSVIVEFIFGVPGLGQLLITAIQDREYQVVQGVTLVIAVGYVVVNVAVDLLYAVVDPRLRRSGAAA